MLTWACLPIPQVVIIQPVDNGNKSHPYGHALVAGIERYPSKITRRMSKTRQEKRSKIKPFVKVVNYNHLMPTRYTLELEGLKNILTADTFKEVSQREDAKKTVKKTLEERYTSGKNRWFFTPLRTSQRTHHIQLRCIVDRDPGATRARSSARWHLRLDCSSAVALVEEQVLEQLC